MNKSIEVKMEFKEGKAVCLLPKGSKALYVKVEKDHSQYLCATANADEQAVDRYVVTVEPEKEFPVEEGMKFLKNIYHRTLDKMFSVYKQC